VEFACGVDSQPFSEDTACFIVAGVFCFSVADCSVAMGGLCQAIVVSRVAHTTSLLSTSLEFQDVSQFSMAFRFFGCFGWRLVVVEG
jgi:hypothetical protein